jgi:hypothetical protein
MHNAFKVTTKHIFINSGTKLASTGIWTNFLTATVFTHAKYVYFKTHTEDIFKWASASIDHQ